MSALNRDDLKDFIVEKTKSYWSSNASPYLLAKISPEFRAEKGISYKDLIFPQTLKQFVGDLAPDVKVVQHPIQKTKIGLIPSTENFTFDDEPQHVNAASSLVIGQRRSTPSKYIVIDFLDALSKLPQEDIEKVDIPLSVLVKLITNK